MKRLLTLAMTMLLLAAMCACGAQDSAPSAPSGSSDSYIPGGLSTAKPEETADVAEAPADKPSGSALADRFTPESAATGEGRVESTESQQFSNDAGTSIDVLREEIGNVDALFGIAYVGYFDGGGGIELTQWLEAASSPLQAAYPFTAEIDESHIIGSQGHLYCVIAKDYNASIVVSTADDDEVLYRSKNGDPIYVFCNLNGDVYTADTAVTITAEDGTVCRWEPTLDEMGFPQLLIGSERRLLSLDFTPIPDTGFDLEEWFAQGWLGIYASGLAGEYGTSWFISTWDGSVNYCMDFYPNAGGGYDGEAVIECRYAGDTAVQAQWQGWWRIESEIDMPSTLYLDVMLTGGGDMASYENASVISEAYKALVHPSGEYLLLVAEGGSALNPAFPEGVQAIELEMALG